VGILNQGFTVHYMHPVMAMGFMWTESTSKTNFYINLFFTWQVQFLYIQYINFYQTIIRHTRIQVCKHLPDHCLTGNKKGIRDNWY
jgi:hypothetical protein